MSRFKHIVLRVVGLTSNLLQFLVLRMLGGAFLRLFLSKAENDNLKIAEAYVASLPKNQETTNDTPFYHQNFIVISRSPTVRDLTFFGKFGERIVLHFSLSSANFKTEEFTKSLTLTDKLVVLWHLASKAAEKQIPIVFLSLSDCDFFYLKLHQNRRQLYFDGYDPVITVNPVLIVRLKTFLGYRICSNFITRDLRFRPLVRLHRQVKSGKKKICTLLDEVHLPICSKSLLEKKFSETETIRFAISGFISAHGDTDHKETVRQILTRFPNARIDACLTRQAVIDGSFLSFCDKNNHFDGRVRVFENINREQYCSILNDAHFSIGVYPHLAFGKNASGLTLPIVKRAASNRFLDYACSGSILVTSREATFANFQFKKYSPHGRIVYFDTHTPVSTFIDAMDDVAAATKHML